MNLSEKSCVPCQGGIPPLAKAEAETMLAQVPGWSLTQDGARLERRFTFRNFASALAFVNQVGRVAEQEDHHPDISFGWGYASIVYYTHKIGGLHENDFVMAAKLNALYE
ncbi:MAG: 4a-hydroxytetrahydrobiopterin dehydratase [Gammaproteobacteria bacterium]|nr:4a-hydroxytetrahydrobiopterin dehydratase [Gammaproteobacteria bacterium]MCP5426616.1 4a-hydroxytetrahydrobiopterin dehydratase [Gammaproteobacteria bacterium]MCP5459141.1 4a-hydroxytetrahydrobiopterin dehydratase [Gammaproteobacteria bacterium]